MDKLLVEIYLPATGRSFDVFIPAKSKLHEVASLLEAMFTELSGGYFASSGDAVLCEKSTGAIYDINKSAEELSLKNGSKLMLV